MALIDELKTKRQDAVETFEAIDTEIKATLIQLGDQQRTREVWSDQIADIDKAIAALEPATVEPALEWVEPSPAHEPAEALPSVDDIIDPDLTGGLQTEEFLDRLHAGTIPDAERTDDESQSKTAIEQTPSPEAAYAPVNDEGLMWAAGFKADFTAKAEPQPEVKRPFWMFTKDPVDA